MTKNENKLLQELSIECFGKKYHYKKLMKIGLIYDKVCVNPNSRKAPAFVAKRIKFTKDGVKMYMKRTIEARKQQEKDNDI